MKKIILILIFAIFLLITSLVFALQIDTFNRADSSTMGTATNGNVWTISETGADDFQILSNQFRYVDNTQSNPFSYAELNLSTNLTSNDSTISLLNLKILGANFVQMNLTFFDSEGRQAYSFIADGGTDNAFTGNGGTIFSYEADPPASKNFTFYLDFNNSQITFENHSTNNVTKSMITAVKNITKIRFSDQGAGSCCGSAFDIDQIDANQTSSDTLLPTITSYNMTSEGGEGCTNWNTDKNNACTTTDTTPTVFIKTDISANCAIGISNLNYTGLGSNRSCSGGGTSQHTCTLINQDAIAIETSYLYIGCRATFGNENQNSTSGALKITLSTSDAETSARNAIEAGVRQALSSGYTIYTSQRVYARNAANSQATGVFDKVVKWMNKVWAFNYLTENQTAAGMFNITPVFYVLETQNLSFGAINTTVSQLIINTK